MKTEDYSKEIYRKYFDSKGKKLVQITLQNDSTIEGFLVGFFDAKDETEPFITKWHFVEKDEIEKYKLMDEEEEIGRFINQSDIKEVEFAE